MRSSNSNPSANKFFSKPSQDRQRGRTIQIVEKLFGSKKTHPVFSLCSTMLPNAILGRHSTRREEKGKEFFYYLRLKDLIPEDHFRRLINQYVDFSFNFKPLVRTKSQSLTSLILLNRSKF
jgi:hypothetical protein